LPEERETETAEVPL